jgi:hypothetical protein
LTCEGKLSNKVQVRKTIQEVCEKKKKVPSNVIKNKKIERYLIKQQTKKFYQSHTRFYIKKKKTP